MNNFQKISIPSFIGSLEKLTYLDLRGAAFSGMVPPHLGNLSNLRHLDLFAWSHARQSCQDSWVYNINWLSGLSSLEYLNLGCVNLGKATTDWKQAVNTIPSLVELTLLGCQLSTFPQSLPFVNLTSLSVLDLSHNHFRLSVLSYLAGCLISVTSLSFSLVMLELKALFLMMPGEIFATLRSWIFQKMVLVLMRELNSYTVCLHAATVP